MSGTKKPEDYEFTRKEEYDNLYKKLNEREPFSYDLNADALYQQYKDKYIGQGKMAMEDAIGQATAMTGGYGNSYAQTVGNQAYQNSLANLNDIIPDLYQMAYNKYNQEGQDMRNMLALLASERDFEYDKYHDDKSYDLEMAKYGLGYDENGKIVASGTKGGKSDSGTGVYADGSGNPIVGGGSTKSASYDAIAKTAEKYKGNNDALTDYLAAQVTEGKITSEEMDTIFADNMTPTNDEKAPYMQRTYTKVDDGGYNWWLGVDGDAIVKDQYNTNFTLDELVDYMVASGVKEKEAKSFVKKLQKELGISDY